MSERIGYVSGTTLKEILSPLPADQALPTQSVNYVGDKLMVLAEKDGPEPRKFTRKETAVINRVFDRIRKGMTSPTPMTALRTKPEHQAQMKALRNMKGTPEFNAKALLFFMDLKTAGNDLNRFCRRDDQHHLTKMLKDMKQEPKAPTSAPTMQPRRFGMRRGATYKKTLTPIFLTGLQAKKVEQAATPATKLILEAPSAGGPRLRLVRHGRRQPNAFEDLKRTPDLMVLDKDVAAIVKGPNRPDDYHTTRAPQQVLAL